MVKIEELNANIQKEILDLKNSGMIYSEIAKTINNKYYFDINEQDIKNFGFKKKKEAIQNLYEEGRLGKAIAEKYFNTIGQLNEANKNIWEIIYKIKADPDYKEKMVSCPHCHRAFKIQLKNYSEIIIAQDHLLKQIAHVDEVLGRLSKEKISVTYNFVDMANKINKIMPEVLDKFERRGLIRRIRKKREIILGEENQ